MLTRFLRPTPLRQAFSVRTRWRVFLQDRGALRRGRVQDRRRAWPASERRQRVLQRAQWPHGDGFGIRAGRRRRFEREQARARAPGRERPRRVGLAEIKGRAMVRRPNSRSHRCWTNCIDAWDCHRFGHGLFKRLSFDRICRERQILFSWFQARPRELSTGAHPKFKTHGRRPARMNRRCNASCRYPFYMVRTDCETSSLRPAGALGVVSIMLFH
jgi:hypothetical protein